MPDSLEELITKFALKNCFDYGKADAKAIVGKVIGEMPDAKKDFQGLMKKISGIVGAVNSLPGSEVERRLLQFHFEEKKVAAAGEKRLPELANAVVGKVVMRIAPNPNGPMHIGHSRMAILNDEYAKRYNGLLILRFDDTDPKNKLPMKEAYQWFKEDLAWLGIKYDKVEVSSSRLKVYYDFCKLCLEKGFAFVCTCDAEGWSEKVRVGRKPCPCKGNDAALNLQLWEKMLNWDLKQGGAVVRIKTKADERNPAIIDWPAFRIIDDPEHPLVGKEVKVWPLLDFASAIDDHEFKVTHILRGKDLVSSEEKQRILYAYLGWDYPTVRVYGKFLTTDDLVVSKSKIKAGMSEGKYDGFDDPLLATIKALRRKGVVAQAIRNYILSLGISESETTVDLDILYAENKKLVEPTAKHYFFVQDPVLVKVKGLAVKAVELSRHPSNKLLGSRWVNFDAEFLIAKTDADSLKVGEVIRLKDLANIKILEQTGGVVLAEFHSNELIKDSKKLQWVSAKPGQNVNASVLSLEKGESGVAKLERKGVCESECANLGEGEMIQFERIGFAVLDSKGEMRFISAF